MLDIKEKEALLCGKYNSIHRLLAIHNVDRQDREDLLHEIFIKAFRSLGKLREIDKMDPWLWSITRNEVSRYWSEIMKRRETMRSLDAEGFEMHTDQITDEHYRYLADQLEHLSDREELVDALGRLSEKTLILFRLYYFEGYRLKEIALITGESESAIKSRHKRGLTHLKKILEEFRSAEEKEMKRERKGRNINFTP